MRPLKQLRPAGALACAFIAAACTSSSSGATGQFSGASSSSGGSCHFSGGSCNGASDCCAGYACQSGVCQANGAVASGTSTASSAGPGTTGSASGTSGATVSGTSSNGATGIGTGAGTGTTSGGPACGGANQVCCAQSTCNGSLACTSGICLQTQTGPTGTACTKNSDCPTGLCIPVGQPAGQNGWTGNVCTTTCASVPGCVDGWTCGPLAGQSSDVCQCTYSPEVCDGKDNDCDGIVDNEPAVDEACDGVCQNGTCACSGGLTSCGDVCADLQTDPNDCGICGTACTSTQTCSAGGCCLAVSTECDSAPSNCCGGLTCGTSGLCCVADGQTCAANGDCCDTDCVNGTCGIPYGIQCSTTSGPPCGQGLVCNNGTCQIEPGTSCPFLGIAADTVCDAPPGAVWGTSRPNLPDGGCPAGTAINFTGGACTSSPFATDDCTAAGQCCGGSQVACNDGYDCCGFFNNASLDYEECVNGACCVSQVNLQGYCKVDADCCTGVCGANGECTPS